MKMRKRRNVLLAAGALLLGAVPLPGAELGVQGSRFTLDGEPVFLLGISYYGALGAPREFIERDLDDFRARGFRWIRVWATWAGFGTDVSAVDLETGAAREPYLEKLRSIVEECDRRGLAVDVTLSRGDGKTGPSKLQTASSQRRAVESLTLALKDRRNWYLDLSNERNIKDSRFTSLDELRQLRELARGLDPKRLVTASHVGDLGEEDLRAYLLEVKLDFLSVHRGRDPRSPSETETQTRRTLALMKGLGRVAPLHYDEPFRRGYGEWQPVAEDFLADARGALAGGAAGWCLHNGDLKGSKEGNPRRSFDLRSARLLDQLDREELRALESLRGVTGKGQ